MSDALSAIQAIPLDPIYTAAVTGLAGFALIALGAGFVALSGTKRDDGPGEFVEDGFEASLVGEQAAKGKRFVAMAMAGIGLIVCIFAIFSATGLEGQAAQGALAAESAAEEGDWQSAVDALADACDAIQCDESQADVIVKPELQEKVGNALALALMTRARELHEAGETEAALDLSERAHRASDSKATVDALNKMLSAQATAFEDAGEFASAGRAFEEVNDFQSAARNYEAAELFEDLCRIYPNIPDYVKAAESCLKSGNTARAGWYYKAGKKPGLAADAYLKSGWKQEGITILVEGGLLERAAREYSKWAEESDERAADRYLAAAGLHEDLGNIEASTEQKRLAADAYARVADSTQNSAQRIAAWQLYADLGDSEAAAAQIELAILKASEFKSVGGLMQLVRMNGEIGRGIDIARGWADEALDRNEPHEAAQYLSLLLSNLMGDPRSGENPNDTLSEEELAQMQAAMPALLATNARIAEKVAAYPTIEVKAFAVSTTFQDSGLQIHNHTTLQGQVTNPHDYPIEEIRLRVILFEPRFDTKELQTDGWRRIMSERGISEEEARKAWEKQTTEREKELYSAPVGFKTDIGLGRIEPGQTVTVDRKLDSDVSYQYIDHYFVGMKR